MTSAMTPGVLFPTLVSLNRTLSYEHRKQKDTSAVSVLTFR